MRVIVKLFVVLAVVLVVPIAAFAGFIAWSYVDAQVDTVGEVDFDRELAIPPLAESTTDADGRRVFTLEMDEGEADLGRDEPTSTWGFNGAHLGPTLRASRGERVLVEVTNSLPEASTVHWHGMHLLAEMDGGPHQMVEPGQTWSPTWQVDQPAATLWYHPHPHGETAEHVYRGLAGLFYLDDPDGPTLPDDYGVDDVPVVVQDKNFDGNQLDLGSSFLRNAGIFGDTILVNGTPGPYLDVTTERVRLRLLNASNARIFDFAFSDRRGFDLIAGDGGLLSESIAVDHLVMSPGERAEIVVTMRPGEEVVLRSGPLAEVSNRFAGTEDSFDVLLLRADDQLVDNAEVPSRLAPSPDLADDEIAQTRRISLTGTSINGQAMEMDRIDLTAELDTTERWLVSNDDGSPHNFHVHDVQFEVVSVDGGPPPPEYAGWQDTVFLPPKREVELAMRFADFADPDTPYMFHCHVLRHEDKGMMAQFVVVEPGQSAGSTDHADHADHAGH